MKLTSEEASYSSIEEELDTLTKLYHDKYSDVKYYEICSDDDYSITFPPIEYAKLSISNHLTSACDNAEYEN